MVIQSWLIKPLNFPAKQFYRQIMHALLFVIVVLAVRDCHGKSLGNNNNDLKSTLLQRLLEDIVMNSEMEVNNKDSEMEVNNKDSEMEVNNKDSEMEVNDKDSEMEVNNKDSEMEVNNKDSDMEVNNKDNDMEVNNKDSEMEVELPSTCRPEFRAIPNHTMCLKDSKLVTKSGVTATERETITEKHNILRGTVTTDTALAAADLMKLYWDNRLAEVAQKWANQCVVGHDAERRVPGLWMPIGQNLAFGYSSWSHAIQGWYDEISMFRYGQDPNSYLGPGGWTKIGHFTQLVQNGTYLIGCGYAECANTVYTRFYACNYAAGQSNLVYPYTSGTRCGKCPNKCVDGLCDCGGAICLNQGVMNPNTCTCTCPKLYTGARCQSVNCPVKDPFYCETQWPPAYCTKYSNVPASCPYMCGICKA